MKLYHLAIIVIFFLTSVSANTGKSTSYGNDFESGILQSFDSPDRDDWQKPELIMDKMGDLSNKTVMDLGAGTGYFTFKLAERASKVIAAEVNDNRLDQIREKMNSESHDNLKSKIEVRKVPYDNPGLASGEADIILLVNTYHHIEDRVNYFKKALEGLTDQGKVMIVDFKKDAEIGPPRHHKLAAEVALKEIKQVGFSEVEYDDESLPYQYIITAIK